MRITALVGAVAGLIVAPVAQAATDPGLMLPAAQAGAIRTGAGVQATITVPLGTRTLERGPRLSLRAGPSIARGATVARPASTRTAPLVEFAVRPGHSTTLSLAGAPVARSFDLTALRDERARQGRAGGKGVSTLGAVGIGLGVLAIAGGIALLVLIDEAEDNSD